MTGQEGAEDDYDESKHAAIHSKVENPQTVSAFRNRYMRQFNGERPTSGKHHARHYAHAKRKGELEMPNHDPMTSNVA